MMALALLGFMVFTGAGIAELAGEGAALLWMGFCCFLILAMGAAAAAYESEEGTEG